MSDTHEELISKNDELKNEIKNLIEQNHGFKIQLANNQQGVQGLLAQLDAHKQIINDSLNQCLGLRTQLIMVQNENKLLNEKLSELAK